MIYLTLTRFTQPLSESVWRKLFQPLPPDLRHRINRFYRWQDRTACLLGKHLLVKTLEPFGFGINSLNDLLYTSYQRPYLEWPGDFNLSHSGEWVACAVSANGSVGVDIEHIRPVQFSDFIDYMQDDEWERIHQSSRPLQAFFDYWTAKESVMKADGRGFYAPLDSIRIQLHTATIEQETWRLMPHPMKDYSCHLAVSSPDEPLSVSTVRLDQEQR